jgi:hypothetical protein
MTPEQKADYLIRKYTLDFTMDYQLTRQAAIICASEVIEMLTERNDLIYWNQVRDFLFAFGTGSLEARADKFNDDLIRS